MLNHINRLSAFTGNIQCSEYESQMIIRLEQALGLSPKTYKGEWQKSKDGSYLYKVSSAKKHKHYGPNPIGNKGSIIRELNYGSAMTKARSMFDSSFIHGDSNRMALHALDLLSIRLRSADSDEDASAIAQAFLFIISQHDFTDRKRSGETLDKAVRKHQMRVLRAEKAVVEAQKRGVSLSVEEAMEKYEDNQVEPAFEASPISEERIVDVQSDIDDDDDLAELDSSNDAYSEEESLERLAANNSIRGVTAPTFLDFDEF